MSTQQISQICELWTASTAGSTICSLDLNLNQFHNPVARISRLYPDNGSIQPLHKMAHFIGLATDATAKDVADTFLQEVWRLHGLPSEIISDMDAKFSG